MKKYTQEPRDLKTKPLGFRKYMTKRMCKEFSGGLVVQKTAVIELERLLLILARKIIEEGVLRVRATNRRSLRFTDVKLAGERILNELELRGEKVEQEGP